jgi:hypothetical protein
MRALLGRKGTISESELGMEQFTEDRDPVHDRWAVAAEVASALDSVDASVLDGRARAMAPIAWVRSDESDLRRAFAG